ncbi:hypothetical protein HAX54_014205, partial [Datura stramonium]|nr:hypothetical protein [Datura stramonium]
GINRGVLGWTTQMDWAITNARGKGVRESVYRMTMAAVVITMTKQNAISDPESGVNTALFSAAVTKPPPLPRPVSCINISRETIFEINGGPRIKSWVDSMRASSPTHHMSTSLYEDKTSWMVEHPSAVDRFEDIISVSKGKQIVMFLDYDGTLSPIVDDPDQAFMYTILYNWQSCTMLEAMGWI